MMSLQQSFLDSIERFLATTGMTPTKFGVDALGDPRFVFDLREGRSCGAKLMDRVGAFMEKHLADHESAA